MLPTNSDDTKNVSVVEERYQTAAIKQPDPDNQEKEVIETTWYKFRNSAINRDRPFQNFDGLSLIDYINESVRRTITNIDYRDDIEDWQARVHDPFTRNKVLAALGKIVQVMPIAEFTGRGDEDFRKGQILTDLYQYSEDLDDYEEFMVRFLLEAITKGTAIGYEGNEIKQNKIRNVDGSGDDIKVTEMMKRTNRLYGFVVPLEDFYPSNVGITRIKDMPYCFWRTILPYEQFLQDYAMYTRASNVLPKVIFSAAIDKRPYYLDYISNDVREGFVEIVRYYNKDVDEYVILANGVWLNPMFDKEGNVLKYTNTGENMMHAVIQPLPFNHKELPFWDTRFELYPGFFYGKSLPDKLRSLQDVLNVLTNMLLDQSFLTVFKPILTSGFDSIEDDYLRPGRRTPVDTQGGKLSDQYMTLDMGTPQGWHEFILNYTRKVMEEASMDQVQSGSAGIGGRTTATEIDAAGQGLSAILGLFGRLIKYGLKRKALLRAKNILQFWTDANSPMIEEVEGQGGAKLVNNVFNTFRVHGTVLTDGLRGTKVIEMYDNQANMPTKVELQNRALLSKAMNNNNVEYVSIDPDYLRNFEFDVKLVIDQKSDETKDMLKALQLEKVRIYMSFFPDVIDHIELASQTAEKLGDDPMKIIRPDAIQQEIQSVQQQKQQQQQTQGAQQGTVDTGMSQTPNGALPNAAMQRAMRAQLQGVDTQQLQSQITG